ncbi:MAG: hypothetical protein DRN71_03935 [Candidatus Nanohalarchaeota archaeon]|nr:MAG: hypothetical protein DRN71_03935 [Candidatus Nanohaloarchaeota archaeon]
MQKFQHNQSPHQKKKIQKINEMIWESKLQNLKEKKDILKSKLSQLKEHSKSLAGSLDGRGAKMAKQSEDYCSKGLDILHGAYVSDEKIQSARDILERATDIFALAQHVEKDAYIPEYVREQIRSSKPVGICKKCGSYLIRDPEGHIGCSNLSCEDNVYQPNKGRRFSTGWNDAKSSIKSGATKTARIQGGSIVRNVKGLKNVTRPWGLMAEGDDKRKEDQRPTETNIAKDDAVSNFRNGKTYKEAVKDQIDTYSSWGWWDRKDDSSKYVLHLQKNEIKKIILHVYRNPGAYGIGWDEINKNESVKKAYGSARGFLGLRGGLENQLVNRLGNWSNRANMGKIAQLQNRLGELDDEERSWRHNLDNAETEEEEKKYSDELKVIEAEKKDLLEKIELIEKHPELAKRLHVRGSRWLGNRKKNIKGGGRKLVGLGKGVKDGANKAVNGAIDGYHKHKVWVAGKISTFCAFLILVILYYMKVLAHSDYIPINGWQILVFAFFAILLEVIKSSMSEDKAGENEAREIIFILALLAMVITVSIRDPSVGLWTSLIFCAIISAYLLMDFYTDSALVTIVLAIVMMVIIYFTAAGWMDTLGVETEKLAVQTGFGDAIKTSFDAIGEGASDVWLMITNPNKWYAKKEAEDNAQKDPTASDRAVEITTAKITPTIVNLGDEINLLVEIENFGDRDTTKPARDVEISAKKIGDHQKHFALEGSQDEEDAEVIRYVGDIISGAGAQEAFEIKAPPVKDTDEPCIATFELETGVSYGYDVDTMGNIFIIGRKRYDELVKQDKLVQEKQVAKSTSGPVSVSIMTNLPQPIPVENGTEFSIHFGIVNTRSSGGKVNVTSVDIAIPKEFVPALKDAAYKNCKLCHLVDSDDNPIVDESFAHYSLKGLYDGGPDTCSANPDKSLLIGGDIKIFKCVIQYNKTIGDDIPFKKPMDIHVSIDYIYKYTKTVSFTVRKRDIDAEEDITKCS